MGGTGGGAGDSRLLIAYAASDEMSGLPRVYASNPDGSSHHLVSGDQAYNGLEPYRWRPGSAELSFVGGAVDDRWLQLQLAPADGSSLGLISGAPDEPSSVARSAWSPDGSRIAYHSFVESLGTSEVFVCKVDDSACTKVSGELEETGGAWLVGWSPDGNRLAYVERKDQTYPQELFTCAADGTDRKRVNLDLQEGSDVDPQAVSWSPDSRWLAYEAYQIPNGYGLYVGAADGSSNHKITSDSTWDVWVFRWSPDGSRIAFSGFHPGRVDLFTNLPDGSEPVLVSTALSTGAFVSDFRWSPDGTRFAYLGDDDTTGTDLFLELHTCKADGSGDQVLKEGNRAYDFDWSPSGNRLAFISQSVQPTSADLFTCAPDGGDLKQVNPWLGAAPSVAVARFAWSPDGSRLAYFASRDPDAESGLFIARADGSENTVVGPRWAFTVRFQWSPDSSRIAYVVGTESFDSTGLPTLFTNTPDGLDEQRVSDADNPLQIIWSIAWIGEAAIGF